MQDVAHEVRERSCHQNIRMQGEAASADGEAAAIYPEDTAETTNESGCTKPQIFSVEEIAFYLKRCHLGLFTGEVGAWLQSTG